MLNTFQSQLAENQLSGLLYIDGDRSDFCIIQFGTRAGKVDRDGRSPQVIENGRAGAAPSWPTLLIFYCSIDSLVGWTLIVATRTSTEHVQF